MNDPRTIFAQATAQTETVIAQVRPDQAGIPTPCTDWDVRQLVTHMVGGVNRIALVGEGADALSVPAFTDLRGGDPREWAAQYREAAARVGLAWADDAKLDQVYALPWGKVPGRAAVAGYVREVLAHGWDLAAATGQETELNQELGAFALNLSRSTLPAEGRENFPFGPVVPTPASAGVYTRFAAWLGRSV